MTRRTFCEATMIAGGTFVVLVVLVHLLGLGFVNYEQGPGYMVDLAWSLLHGRVDLTLHQATDLDLSPYRGRVYAYWPPLSAILMMPFVAITGPAQFPNRLFSIALDAIAAGLCYLIVVRLLSHRLAEMIRTRAAILSLTFAFGSTAIACAVFPTVNYGSQLVGVLPVLASLYWGLDRDPATRRRSTWLMGICFGITIVGRANQLLSLPIWLYLAVSDTDFDVTGTGAWWRRAVAASLDARHRQAVVAVVMPSMAAVLLMMGYNYARFDSLLEMGIRYHQMDPFFRSDFTTYGYWNWRYVPRNLYFELIRPPAFRVVDGAKNVMGFGVLYQNPLLLYALFGTQRRTHPGLANALWLALALVTLPIVFCMGTGYAQFGARYLFDVYPYLLVLTAMGASRAPPRRLLGLGIVSAAINIYGIAGVLHEVPWLP